jgi:hypothetical protein
MSDETRTIVFEIVCDADEASDWRDRAHEVLDELMHDKVHMIMSRIETDECE